jgi:ABC-type uncharacterized transport system substrate-binding protein
MKRREFISLIGGAAVAWPLAARAQQPPLPVIGFLGTGVASEWSSFVAAFRQGLAEADYEDGRNLKIEFRWAEGQGSRLPELASDLGSRQPSAIVASVGIAAARAVKVASPNIPTVFIMGGDPAAKRVGLLRELLPTATVLGLLVNPGNPNAETDTREAQAAARSLGQQTHVVQVRSERDFDAAFASLVERGAAALFVASDPLFLSKRGPLVMLAAAHRLPAIYDRRELAAAGGLISYGSNFADAHRLVGGYVGRILRGEKPGDLPVVQATKFELVLNLTTAKALGLEVPDRLLALADEVIE